MLRDCDSSRVWEASFIAVNMHPLHRINFGDWLMKISGFVKAAEKFEQEVINVSELLPKSWLQTPLAKRQEWLSIIKADGESWDVDLLVKLRAKGMTLPHLSNIFKLYHAEKRIEQSFRTPENPPKNKKPGRPSKKVSAKQKGRMIYHMFKVSATLLYLLFFLYVTYRNVRDRLEVWT